MTIAAHPDILVIQNFSAAPPGLFGAALAEAGASLRVIDIHDSATPALPSDSEFDGLVVLGGPMSAACDADYPRLAEITELIGRAHSAAKPYFGICLGAQLLARALGTEPRLNLGWEIGFTPLRLTSHGRDDPLFGALPDSGHYMEMHQNSFFLPAGARLLMSGTRYQNQAYCVGRHSYGVQFHPEVDGDILAGWREMVRSSFPVEDAETKIEALMKDADRHLAAQKRSVRILAENWLNIVRKDMASCRSEHTGCPPESL